MKKFKWKAALLAFLLTLGLSVGMMFLRQRQMVNEPLLKRLDELQSVETVELQQEDGLQVLVVKLNDVEDFPAAYQKLRQEIEKFLAKNDYRLDLLDQRDQLLSEAYLAVQLALYEGEQRGNFTEMAQYVARTLNNYEIAEHQLTVDQNNIYLKLKNEGAYLYATIKRDQQAEDGERA